MDYLSTVGYYRLTFFFFNDQSRGCFINFCLDLLLIIRDILSGRGPGAVHGMLRLSVLKKNKEKRNKQ